MKWSFHTCLTKRQRLHSVVTLTEKINVLTLHLHSSLVGFCLAAEQTSGSPPCSDTIVAVSRDTLSENSHVQVLLCLLDVPLDGSVDVEVELLGHWQRDQRRSLRVWLLTACIEEQKKHVGVNCGRVELVKKKVKWFILESPHQ